MIKAYQVAALILYPATVLFLSTTLAGRVPPSYFSDSHNVLNVFFVKLGWLWTTLAFGSLVVFQLLSPTQQPAPPTEKTAKNQQRRTPLQLLLPSLARYMLMTLYWFGMTQWLLGPSLVDRMFVATGGSCHFDNITTTSASSSSSTPMVLQQATCRATGGSWHGGHDISGHCVLLIHASLFLWEEMMRQSDRRKRIFALALLGLWYWMLAMTSIYFHGYRELLSGAFFGVLGWAIVYLGLVPHCRALSC